MSKRLSKYINSAYIEAMNRLQSKRARRKVIVYVESYDDVFFWRQILDDLENEKICFEVMLPSRSRLSKGKKEVLSNILGDQLGQYMIACVDADYDYIMQGATMSSQRLCFDPCVFHTYVYAIENYRCFAPALRKVCVLSTLNDKVDFDFESFLSIYSQIIWPLFVWNVWAYKYDHYKYFSLQDFAKIIHLSVVDYRKPEFILAEVEKAVNRKVNSLQNHFGDAHTTYKRVKEDLLNLGLTPQTTYLYIRGHDLLNLVVLPLMQHLCDVLHHEKENEIRRLAVHRKQADNELSGYRHSAVQPEEILRRHSDFQNCTQYQRVKNDLKEFVANLTTNSLVEIQ